MTRPGPSVGRVAGRKYADTGKDADGTAVDLAAVRRDSQIWRWTTRVRAADAAHPGGGMAGGE